MDNSAWVALVGPFPAELRPASRWRDRYRRAPRTIAADGLEAALSDRALDSVILHWNLPERLSLAQRVLDAERPLCLPGPLTRAEAQLLQSAGRGPLLGAPSHALPAVRAMRLALGEENTGPARYAAVRRLTQPAPAAPRIAPLADAITAAVSLIDDTPDWIFANRGEHKGTTTINANVHFPTAEAAATWVQTPGGPAFDEWLLYGTRGMAQQRDENADHTLAAGLFDHWLSVRTGRDEPLLRVEQAVYAARIAQAVAESLRERRRVDWQEVAENG